MATRRKPGLGGFVYFALAFSMGAYFTFAAVQGDYGLFRRAEIVAQGHDLEIELAKLNLQNARMENLARRLSDDFLELDLLDEQARSVLGLLRADEIVVR